MTDRHILATSGGFLPSPYGLFHSRRGPLVEHALSLSGRERPRLTHVGTAFGDSVVATAAFYSAFAGCDDVVTSHLELFPLPNTDDVAAHLLAQDVIWVGGGSVANLLAVWRVHGLDEVFREAWERGIVLAGVSAGSICWHLGGTTDSFGALRPVTNGLGLLPHSNGVHHDSEPGRRPLFQSLVADGTLPAGFATDDGVGLHYVGTELHEVLSDRPAASAYRVEPDGHGGARETTLTPRLLRA